MLLLILVALLGPLVAFRAWRLHDLNRNLAAEKIKAADDRTATVAQHAKELQVLREQARAEELRKFNEPAWQSGSAAREAHEKEWNFRVAHDPQFARTALETNLLAMELLGQDETVAAQTALEKVALLASPQGSRVEVTPDQDGYRVRVAFMMSRLSSNEAGAVTKHHTNESLRGEIEELSARVLRDLYGFCGSRGIRSIAVTCNHTMRQTAIPDGATEEERAELLRRAEATPRRLYRASLDQSHAKAVANWRRVPLSRIVQLYTVEYDGITKLKIGHDEASSGSGFDPAGPLEF